MYIVELSVVRVVLYRHGVAFFERTAEIEGDAELRLRFRTSQMNDVLKTLTVVDEHGEVGTVAYDSILPQERKLEDIPLSLDRRRILTSLIEENIGVRVRVVLQHERGIVKRELEGRICGLQTLPRVAGDRTVEIPALCLAVDECCVRMVYLDEIAGLHILDERRSEDLGRLLDVFSESSAEETRRLLVRLRGNGRRRVRVSYVVEAPVWKITYRLALDRGGEGARLQAWAVVDNMSGEDWRDVELVLVGGTPFSFVHDLYTPRYVERPAVGAQTTVPYGADAVTSSSLGMGEAHVFALRQGAEAFEESECSAAREGAGPCTLEERMAPRAGLSTVAAAVARETAGEYVRHVVETPVTVESGRAALVPILDEEMEAGDVLVHDERRYSSGLLCAVVLDNTLGCALEGGPVCIYRDGVYVGESMLEGVAASHTAILPYGVETDVTCRTRRNWRVGEVHLVRIVNGMLSLYRARFDEKTYSFENGSDEEKRIYVHHYFNPGWELVSPSPLRSESDSWIFEVGVEAGGKNELTVVERKVDEESYALADVDDDLVELWIDSGYIPSSGHIASVLKRVASMAADLRNLKEELETLQQERKELERDQKRFRENLKGLGRSGEESRLRGRYVESLEKAERRMEELSARKRELRRDIRRLEKKMRETVSSVEGEFLLPAEE